MTTAAEVSDGAERAASLAQELIAADKLTSPDWHAAVLAAPRHVFVPCYYVPRDGSMVKIDATTALVTKLAQGSDGAPPAG